MTDRKWLLLPPKQKRSSFAACCYPTVAFCPTLGSVGGVGCTRSTVATHSRRILINLIVPLVPLVLPYFLAGEEAAVAPEVSWPRPLNQVRLRYDEVDLGQLGIPQCRSCYVSTCSSDASSQVLPTHFAALPLHLFIFTLYAPEPRATTIFRGPTMSFSSRLGHSRVPG